MARHSKWHNIQVRKGKQDKSRGTTFTKLARYVTVAARQGGANLEMNFSLRLAIERARAANMPKDNIDRAIKRGTGELNDEAILEELMYEGFGPGNVSMLVEVVTDNRNRSVGDIKAIFGKQGGNMAGPGSVQWQFEHHGVIRFGSGELDKVKNKLTDLELALIEAGADDITFDEDGAEITTPVEKLKSVSVVLEEFDLKLDESNLEWLAKEKIKIDESTQEQLFRLIETLEEHDDVKNVYTNVD